jgi:hypothetical protein
VETPGLPCLPRLDWAGLGVGLFALLSWTVGAQEGWGVYPRAYKKASNKGSHLINILLVQDGRM